MGCESLLHGSGPCRSQRHFELHCCALTARRAKSEIARPNLIELLLPAHPLLGTRTDEPGFRRLIATPYPYLIFYEAGNDEIIIHAVRHAARDPESMPGSA